MLTLKKTRAAHELNDVVAKVGSPGGKDPRYALWSIAGAADGRPTCQRLACAVVNGKPGSTAVYVSKAPRLLPGEPVSVVDVTPEAHDLVPAQPFSLPFSVVQDGSVTDE